MWLEDLAAEPDPLAALLENSVLTRVPDRGCDALPGGLSGRDRGTHRAAPPRNGGRREALRLLLDEMYPTALAEALRVVGIDACTVVDLELVGRSDP
jgi:hypothetical protein